MRLQGCCARSGVGFVQLDRCAWGGVCTVGIFLCLVRIISQFGTWSGRLRDVIGRFRKWIGRFHREISRLYDPLAFQSKNPQSGISSLWGFVSLNDSVRFNQSVFTVSTFVYDVCTIGFRIGEDEEIVAEHVHLENGFILIHRFQIELFCTYD